MEKLILYVWCAVGIIYGIWFLRKEYLEMIEEEEKQLEEEKNNEHSWIVR